jgi:ribosomal protein L37AE/L43A
MAVLTTDSTTLDRLVPEKNQHSGSIKIAQSMHSRQICLCCSNPLLRHIGLGKLYWRCSHCYQSMPVMEDAKAMPLPVTCEEAFQQFLVLNNSL